MISTEPVTTERTTHSTRRASKSGADHAWVCCGSCGREFVGIDEEIQALPYVECGHCRESWPMVPVWRPTIAGVAWLSMIADVRPKCPAPDRLGCAMVETVDDPLSAFQTISPAMVRAAFCDGVSKNRTRAMVLLRQAVVFHLCRPGDGHAPLSMKGVASILGYSSHTAVLRLKNNELRRREWARDSMRKHGRRTYVSINGDGIAEPRSPKTTSASTSASTSTSVERSALPPSVTPSRSASAIAARALPARLDAIAAALVSAEVGRSGLASALSARGGGGELIDMACQAAREIARCVDELVADDEDEQQNNQEGTVSDHEA